MPDFRHRGVGLPCSPHSFSAGLPLFSRTFFSVILAHKPLCYTGKCRLPYLEWSKLPITGRLAGEQNWDYVVEPHFLPALAVRRFAHRDRVPFLIVCFGALCRELNFARSLVALTGQLSLGGDRTVSNTSTIMMTSSPVALDRITTCARAQ